MNYTEKGSKLYLFSIVLVAVIGGLLFGYDTAVISGAEKGLQAFFMGADFEYTDAIHGITSSSALIGCIIGSAVSGFFASWKNIRIRSGREKVRPISMMYLPTVLNALIITRIFVCKCTFFRLIFATFAAK